MISTRTIEFETTKEKYKDLCYKEIMFDHEGRIVQKLTGITSIEVISGKTYDMEPDEEYEVIVNQKIVSK